MTAEFLNQPPVEPVHDAMGMMGRQISPAVRQLGHDDCKRMGLIGSLAFECVQAVAGQLEHDRPYEAMAAGMRYLDLTGTYRLFAVLLCGVLAEQKVNQ